MSTSSKPQVIGAAGAIALGARLGFGGEGEVFAVADRSDLVAKIYRRPMEADRASKIVAMTKMKNEGVLSVAAWPTELLTSVDRKPCGFLMPRVVGYKDIHNLYSPRSRRTEFASADWRFLIAAAANTARAFATVHETGAVIGDVNHGGITVSERALVKLIDCDSFQVDAAGTRYFCDVGTPTFTPPELQSKSFRGVTRTANHDDFGLAVLVFHLLFSGRHPFAGRFLGRGEMSLEQAIKECRFAYGHARSMVQMEPPPGAPPLEISSQSVALLFERAFSPQGANGARPTAREWVTALDGLVKQTKQCGINASHHYHSSLPSCPWCHVEATTGVVLFNVSVSRNPQTGAIQFDIRAAWNAISSVQSPGPAPQRLTKAQLGAVTPSAEALEAGGSSAARAMKLFGVLIGSIVMMATAPKLFLLWLIGGIFIASQVGGKTRDSQVISSYLAKQQAAEAQYQGLLRRWEAEASEARFNNKLAELRTKRDQLADLPNQRQARFRQMELQREKAQLKRFLEKFDIEDATIAGIGPSRKVVLASYNVETAWDVDEFKIRNVPGFGPSLTAKLIDWRRQVERRFRFDPSKGVDPSDIAVLDRSIADAKRNLEVSLANGASDLQRLAQEIKMLRSVLGPQIDEAIKQLKQAEVDLQTVRS